MSDRLESLASRSVKGSYVKQGIDNLKTRENKLYQLLEHKKLPTDGYDESFIQYIIETFSSMDSNNFSSNCGVGEREGRVYSSLVRHRHFGLSHGIGRSGDIAEVQPKAAGSSLIYSLTNDLVHHAIQLAGMTSMKKCLVVPMATGMSISLCLSSLKTKCRNPQQTKYVIWPRIDQKSCFKSISSANCVPLVVENIMKTYQVNDVKNSQKYPNIASATSDIRKRKTPSHQNDTITSLPNESSSSSSTLSSSSTSPLVISMETDVDQIEALLKFHCDSILCVLSTTSCFAPRQPDTISNISVLCKQYNVGHIINNAYGLQCKYICKQINRACLLGRVDAVVQSTDKNFMVPVGGAVIASPSATIIDAISAHYPGRASMSPALDLFITLLSMGKNGYTALLTERERLFQTLQQGVGRIAHRYGEEVIYCPYNSISIAVTLRHLDKPSSIITTTNAATTTTTATNTTDVSPGLNASLSCRNVSEGGEDIILTVPDATVGSITEKLHTLDIDPPVVALALAAVRSNRIDNTLDSINSMNSSNDTIAADDTTVIAKEVLVVSKVDENSFLPSSSSSSSSSSTRQEPTFFGAMLFQRQVSGCRVVAKSTKVTIINNISFSNWGAHTNMMDCSYFTAACAIGMTQEDVNQFLTKLEKSFQKMYVDVK